MSRSSSTSLKFALTLADGLCCVVYMLYLVLVPGFYSRRYQIFSVAVGLESGPLNPCEDK
jgi:hypothetical protein